MGQTLALAARRNISLFSENLSQHSKEVKYELEGDTLVHASGVPVFRSGTFRDSMGFQHQWDDIHLDQMIANFNFLRDRKLFEDVPVRVGHPGFFGEGVMDHLVGYVTELYKETRTAPHDGKEYSYLVADYSILDAEYSKKIQSGLFKNRSSEIGSYFTNDEMELWPTFMGFAFVDIPAVEGLNFSKYSTPNRSILIDGDALYKEVHSMGKDNSQQTFAAPPVPPVPTPPQQAASTAQPAPSQHAAQPAASNPFTFRINGGVECSDFAKVQAHIDALEGAQAEQIQLSRKQFVEDMFSQGKIVESQREHFEKLALGFTTEQFQSFRAAYDQAPVQEQLAQHQINNKTGEQSDPVVQNHAATELINAREIVMRHKISGMKPEHIKQTKSYKMLEAANQVPTEL